MEKQGNQNIDGVPGLPQNPVTPPPVDEAGRVLARIMETSGKSTRQAPVQPYWAKRPSVLPDLHENSGLHEDSILNRQERRLLESIETTPAGKYYSKKANHFNVFRNDGVDNSFDKSDQPFIHQIPEVSLQGSYRDFGPSNGLGSYRSVLPEGVHHNKEHLDPFHPHLLPQIGRNSSEPQIPIQATGVNSSRQLNLLLSQDPTGIDALNAPVRNQADLEKISSVTRSTAGNKSHELSDNQFVDGAGPALSRRHN
jgi:hypothetical protein